MNRLALALLLLSGCPIVGPRPETQVFTYRDNGGYFTKPVIGDDGTIFVSALSKCFYAFKPDGKVKWKYAMGNVSHSDPSFDNAGNLYFGSNNGYVHSLRQDGTLRWRKQVKGRVEAGVSVEWSRVYVATMAGYVYSFDTDGHLRWSIRLPKGSQTIKFTPIMDGSSIIVGTESGGDNALGLVLIQDLGNKGKIVRSLGHGGAYRIGGVQSGGVVYTSEYNAIQAVSSDLTKILWSVPVLQVHRSHPVLSPDQSTVYQGSRDTNLVYAIDAATGAVKWTFDAGSSLVMTPAVDPVTGTIYIGQAAGGPYFFAINPDGTEKWRHDTNHSLRSTPGLSLDGSTVYSGTNVGGYFALSASDGEELWSYEAAGDKSTCKKMQ